MADSNNAKPEHRSVGLSGRGCAPRDPGSTAPATVLDGRWHRTGSSAGSSASRPASRSSRDNSGAGAGFALLSSGFSPPHHGQHGSRGGWGARGDSRSMRDNGNWRTPRHPLSDARLADLLRSSNEEVVLALSNDDNKFEDLIKSKLQMRQFEMILGLLKKVADSDLDVYKIHVMVQACQPEFLSQFNGFLLQGAMTSAIFSTLLSDLLQFFEMVLRHLPKTACDKLRSAAPVILVCARGLVDQGRVTVQPDLMAKLKSFVNDLDKIGASTETKKLARESKVEQKQYEQPPNDFREISIYPTIEDIFPREPVFLRPNLVHGAYHGGVEHYLDVQFRLLREDYVRPLREGIADHVRGGPSTRRCESSSVRIYKDVKFLGFVQEEKDRVREGILLSFPLPKGRSPIDWQHSKRFMYGTLLCFTKNNFDTMLFATVSGRDEKYLKNGQILITFCEKYDEDIYDEWSTYLMVESEVFFQPYYQVLKTLKAFHEDNFPMADYIIEMNDITRPPKYLQEPAINPEISRQMFSLAARQQEVIQVSAAPVSCTLRSTSNQPFTVRVLDESTWPTAEQLGLDPSQRRALFTALTSELAVIQGPPGTGKTFMALKIAQTLIENKENTGCTTPILVVCLTNHALDQFLVGILQFTKNVIRIGGQSKCEELRDYNLRNRRQKSRGVLGDAFWQLCDTSREMEGKLSRLKDTLNAANDPASLLGIGKLSKVVEHPLDELKEYFLDWITGFEWNYPIPELDDEFLSLDAVMKILNDKFEEEWLYSEDYIKTMNYDQYIAVGMRGQLQYKHDMVRQVVRELQYQLADVLVPGAQELQQIYQIIQFNSLWDLNPLQRQQLYAHWRQELREYVLDKLRSTELAMQDITERLDEVRMLGDLEVLRDSDVVGLTTNGAARLHKMLKNLRCQIVIVEEAAEVMESHVVSCLTYYCEHLVLIGDHKQLRPHTEVYELTRDYNFDVSLFERLVRNRGQCETLGVQHRMAPLLATLVVPTIYPHLENDPSVLEREPVQGLPHHLFFIDHRQLEQHDSDISSRRNEHEAKFLLALCRHLVLQGLEQKQITILATYKGQMFHIKKEIRNRPEYSRIQEVHVTVVDNFQGEENEVILLSLVRSNEEKRIGFLATENRMCVALSRARRALYITGNMEVLAAASKTWRAVRESLEAAKGLGPALPLSCQVHPEMTCEVASAADFARYAPEGGCTQICTAILDCSHPCGRVCHLLNRDHTNMECNKENPCLRQCAAELHPCPKRCYQVCGNCMEVVEKELPCGHSHDLHCFMKPENWFCKVMVEKSFSGCEHKATIQCSDKACPLACESRLDCGHACVLTCHPNHDPDHLKYFCRKACPKMNKNCKGEHPCPLECYEDCVECAEKVKKKRSCGHEFTMKCVEDPEEKICKQKCRRILTSCSHWCTRACNEPCEPCKQLVDKTIEGCGHKVRLLCGEPALSENCSNRCERQLPCGHPCTELCSKPCLQQCAVIVEEGIGPCGHPVPLFCWEKTGGLTKPSDSVGRCRARCDTELPCGHQCLGSCGSCKQGRFHLPCTRKCQRTLICGHRCKAQCSVPCPITCMEKNCENRCAHKNTCKNACSMPCNKQGCKLKCNWSCEHFKCSVKCWEPCNRPRCETSCPKELKCGHACSGFCGEACPALCWSCDQTQLTREAFVLGEEQPPEPRFVVLLECKHILESGGLERWLAWQEERLLSPSCPRCDTRIFRTPRYRSQALRTFEERKSVQNKSGPVTQQHQQKRQKRQRGQPQNNPRQKRLLELKDTVEQLRQYKDFWSKVLEPHLMKLRVSLISSQFANLPDLMLANRVSSVEVHVDLLIQLRSELEHPLAHKLQDRVNSQVSFVLECVEARPQGLGQQELLDLSLELLRLRHLLAGLQHSEDNFVLGSEDATAALNRLHRQQDDFFAQVCVPRRYNPALAKPQGSKDEKPLKLKIQMQNDRELWRKCKDCGEVNFMPYVPRSEIFPCTKCAHPISVNAARPKFLPKSEVTQDDKDKTAGGTKPQETKSKGNVEVAAKETSKSKTTKSSDQIRSEPTPAKEKSEEPSNTNKEKSAKNKSIPNTVGETHTEAIADRKSTMESCQSDCSQATENKPSLSSVGIFGSRDKVLAPTLLTHENPTAKLHAPVETTDVKPYNDSYTEAELPVREQTTEMTPMIPLIDGDREPAVQLGQADETVEDKSSLQSMIKTQLEQPAPLLVPSRPNSLPTPNPSVTEKSISDLESTIQSPLTTLEQPAEKTPSVSPTTPQCHFT